MRPVLVAVAVVWASVLVSGCGTGSRSAEKSAPTPTPRQRSPVRSEERVSSYDLADERAPFAFAVAGEAEGGAAGSAYSELSLDYEPAEPASGPIEEALPSEEAPAIWSPPAAERREAEDIRRDPGPEPPRIRQSRIQSGTLTAGSFDDVEQFDDYRQFLSEAMQGDAGEKLPRIAIGQRVMIHVSDERGAPVGDARVVVREADPGARRSGGVDSGGPVLLDLPTGSDGRTMLLTGLDAPGRGGEFLVTVHPPDGAEPVTQVMHLDQRPWRITLPDARARLPKRLDLALVIDTTGSMSDELEYLKVEIDSIAKTIYQLFPNVDQRYALVVYRDEGDQYVTRTFDFTGSLEEFRGTLSEQSAQGGGDYPEAMHLALASAGELDWRERDTARVLFLVADAPPHDRFAGRTLEAVQVLRNRGVRVFPVAASGAAMKAEFVMRAAGFLTLGQYLFLTDHSGVGNPHAEPHVPEYQVARLERLMVRMIASELAGRRLAAEEVLAIERGDGSLPWPDEGPVPEGQQQSVRVSAAAHKPSTWPSIPRWVVLVAAIFGACIVDSMLTRRRP